MKKRRMERKRRTALFLSGICLLLITAAVWFPAEAAELSGNGGRERREESAGADTENVEEKLMGEFDFRDVDGMLAEIFPGKSVSFQDMTGMLKKGDIEGFLEMLTEGVKEQVLSMLERNRAALVHIFILALIAAVFANFSHVFSGRQAADTGFFIVYLFLLAILMKSFGILMDGVKDGLTLLTEFMKVLSPAYCLAAAFASGSTTSVLFYNLLLILIYAVENIVLKVVLPFIHVHMAVRVLDYLSPEPYLTRFAELLEMAVRWALKTMLVCVAGINVMQGLISPALDAVKRSGLQRGLEAIPGIGGAVGQMTEVVMSAVVLIKNGIGIAGAAVCVIICAVPLLQIGAMTFFYKLIAAAAQPVSDRRIVGCIAAAGDGTALLLRAVYTSAVLFLLTIVVIAAFGA